MASNDDSAPSAMMRNLWCAAYLAYLELCRGSSEGFHLIACDPQMRKLLSEGHVL